MKSIQEVMGYYFMAVRSLTGESKSEVSVAYYLGMCYMSAVENRRRYKDEKEKCDIFLDFESECSAIFQHLINSEE